MNGRRFANRLSSRASAAEQRGCTCRPRVQINLSPVPQVNRRPLSFKMNVSKYTILNTIIGKREQKARWVFIIASLPFFLFSLWGYQYGAFIFYFIPGLICIAHFFYPTLFGWFFIFCLYIIGSCYYLFAVFEDIYKILGGRPSGIFLDFDDTIIFSILILIIIALTFALIKLRPIRLKD
jgi:hypothetical protein